MSSFIRSRPVLSKMAIAGFVGLMVGMFFWSSARSTSVAQESDSPSSNSATIESSSNSNEADSGDEGSPEEPVKQEAWQYSPYRIQVWVALDYDGALTPSLVERIRRRIVNGAEAVAFSTWEVEVAAVPDKTLRADIVQDVEGITSNQLFALAGMSTVRLPDPNKPVPTRKSTSKEAEEEEKEKWTVSPIADSLRDTLNNFDKILMIAVRSTSLGFEVVGREVDTPTRHISLPYTRSTRQRSTIADQAFGILYDSFRPVVRLESVEKNGKDAMGLIRAGGLIEGPDSPSRVATNDALLPIIRSNDRLGQPKEFNGIRTTDWTYLHVTDQKDEEVSLRLHTALRSPLGGRGGSRIQKYGLKVRPRDVKSTVRLISNNRGRPLSGYEIFSRHVTDKEDSVFIGLTNWNGEIEVEQQGDFPLRLMYIKNGGMLLAGIPLLAGHYEFTQAEMRDDEMRLQAEAFIKSVQNTILDTVAQRQMISARIEKYLQEGDKDNAKQQLTQYRSLSSLPAVLDLLNRRKKDLSSSDRRMQMQIDLMFEDTQKLAVEYLDESLEVELNRKVNGGAAVASRPAAPSTPSPMPSTPPPSVPSPSTPAEAPSSPPATAPTTPPASPPAGATNTAPSNSATSQATLAPPPVETVYPKADIAMTANEWHEKYYDNNDRMRTELKGKVVDLTGTVHSFNGNSALFITDDGKRATEVKMAAERPWLEAVPPITATVRTRFDGDMMGDHQGYFVSIGESQAVTCTAAQLEKDRAADSKSFGEKYKKAVVVSGVIKSIGEEKNVSNERIPVFHLKTDSSKDVRVTFGNPAPGHLKVGDTLKVHAGRPLTHEGFVKITFANLMAPLPNPGPLPQIVERDGPIFGKQNYLVFTADELGAWVKDAPKALASMRDGNGKIVKNIDLKGTIGPKVKLEFNEVPGISVKNAPNAKIVFTTLLEDEEPWSQISKLPEGSAFHIEGTLKSITSFSKGAQEITVTRFHKP